MSTQPQRTIPYFTLRGWGQVSKTVSIGSFISQVSAGLRPDEIRIGLGDYRPFEGYEGATVYLSGCSGGANPKAADGYYTIIDVNSGSGRITLKGQGVVPSYSTTTVGYGDAKVRLEDFYKVSQGGIPDFVTGANARANWLPYLIGSTNTISQKIEPPGGVATIDGFTFKVQYKSDDAEIQNLLKRLPVSVFTAGGTRIWVKEDDDTSGDTSLVLNDDPADQYIADAESGGILLYDNVPLFANGEAFIIEDYNTSTNIATITRSVLRTPLIWQSFGTLLSHGLPQAQGSLIEFWEIPSWARCFDDTDIATAPEEKIVEGAKSLYFGLIDNITFDEGITQFDIEVSSVLLKAKVSSIPSQFREAGQLSLYENLDADRTDPVIDDIDTTLPKRQMQVGIKGRFSGFNWGWIQLGKVALRIGLNRKAEVPTAWRRDILYNIPAYETYYPIQDIMAYVEDDLPYSSYRYADFCVVEKFDNSTDFNRIVNYLPEDTWSLGRRNFFWMYRFNFDANKIVWAVEDIINTADRETDARRGDDFSKIAPCHIFEMGGGPYKQASRSLLEEASRSFPRPEESGAVEVDSNPYVYQSVIDIRDLILQVLTSVSGKLVNPVTFTYEDSLGNVTTVEQSFDVLPEGVGLGIPGDLIDTSSDFFMRDPSDFESRLPGGSDVFFNMANVYVTAKDATDMLAWLKSKVLEPLGYALVQSEQGKIALIDLADDKNKQFPEITISELVIDGDNIAPDVPQEYDSTRLISSIRSVTYAPQVRFYDSTSITTVPVESQSDDSLGIPALTWGQATNQTAGKAFVFDNLFTIKVEDLSERSVKLLNFYNIPTSQIEIRVRDEDLYTAGAIDINRVFQRNIGSITPIRLENVTSVTGIRGGLQYGLIKNIRREFQSRTSVVRILLFSRPVSNNFLKRWTASGEVSSASSTVLNLVAGFYNPISTDDSTGFRASDEVVLFSENLELKSLAQTVQSVATNQITLASSFIDINDGVTPITATAGDIIVHAPIGLQPVVPEIRAKALANFSIEPEVEDYDTTRYE